MKSKGVGKNFELCDRLLGVESDKDNAKYVLEAVSYTHLTLPTKA